MNINIYLYNFTDDGTYKFEDDRKQLVLSNIQETSLGLYKCVGEDDEVIREFDVDSSFKLRGLPKSISVDDGTKAVIECKAKTVSSFNCLILELVNTSHCTAFRPMMMSHSSGSQSQRTGRLTPAMSALNLSVPRDPRAPPLIMFSQR